ncbi:hypothetical protein WJX79_007031 [Trebouxia sp. C0005]
MHTVVFALALGCLVRITARVDTSVCHNRTYDGSIQQLTEPALDQTQHVPVFVVNARPSRCSQMQRVIESTGMSSYVVAGSSIHSRFLHHLRDEGLVDEPNEQSTRFVAVWRSHRAVWEHVQELGLAQALVLEDDVDMERDILQTINEIVQASNQLPLWDLLYLGHIMDGLVVTEASFRLDATYTVRTASTLYGAHAYIISLKAAQFLLKHMKIRDVMAGDFDAFMAWNYFDDHGGPEGKSTLTALVVQPAVVVQLPNLPGTSDISPQTAVRKYDTLRNSTRRVAMLEGLDDLWDML